MAQYIVPTRSSNLWSWRCSQLQLYYSYVS